MSADTIKEFLVALGFKVDSTTYKKFKDGIDTVTKAIEYLSVATGLADTAIGAFVLKASENLDKLYFATGRLNSSATNINAMQYGLSQLGVSSDAALRSMESLGNFIRTYPGSEEFLKSWGVAPEHVKDTAAALKDLEHTFQGMTFWQAKPIAQVLGIDDQTLLAMQSGQLDKFLDDYNARLKEVGVNEDDAAKKGNRLWTEIRGIGVEFKLAGEALVENFYNPLLYVIRAFETFVRMIGQVGKGLDVLTSSPSQWLKNASKSGFFSWHGTDLVGAPALSGAPNAATSDAASKARAYFQAQGWSAAQAAGMVDRLQKESAMNTGAIGDGGSAYGIAQWHPDRQAAFAKWAGHDIRNSTIDEQLGFVNYELTSGNERNAGNALRGTLSESDAYDKFTRLYERPANPGSAPVVNQQTTINVTGSDPQSIAASVAARQTDINNQLVRNVAGAVQ
jgi:hypothetical protein